MRYPAIEPYEQGLLDVGDRNRIHWETSGNPAGKPALVVHGGPGSGSKPGPRRSFDRSDTGSSSSTNGDAVAAARRQPIRLPI